MKADNCKLFFESKNLVLLIDAMAQKYGKTPFEIAGMTCHEFAFNSAVMMLAILDQKKQQDLPPGTRLEGYKSAEDWKKIGIERTVVKKEKT